MYQVNNCSPVWVLRPADGLIVASLMVMFTLYIIIDFLLVRSINKLKLEDKKLNSQTIDRLTKEHRGWKNTFLQMFGNHAVATGFALSFSPYTFEVLLSFSYIITYMYCLTKLFKYESKSDNAEKLMKIINLALMICGMVGLSRCNAGSSGICMDSKYR